MRISLVLLAVVLLHTGGARAQSTALAEAEARIAAGDAEQARALVQQWRQQQSASANVSAAEQAQALFLEGRLARTPNQAEQAYLAVALSHPTAPFAADALLRLGQGRLALGDARQAIVYFERLLADYPRSEQRAVAGLWLARALSAASRRNASCEAVSNALRNNPDPDIAALLRQEQALACSANAATPPQMRADTRPPPAASVSARFAVQVAAYREVRGARATLQRLRTAGFSDARLVTIAGNNLFRVRVGKFETGTAAAALMQRVKSAGFAAVIVSDALREHPVAN